MYIYSTVSNFSRLCTTSNMITKIMCFLQGRSQEFSFTEARLKGKGTSDAGGLGRADPQKLMQYIKVTFSNLLNSYDNTMAYYVHNCV